MCIRARTAKLHIPYHDTRIFLKKKKKTCPTQEGKNTNNYENQPCMHTEQVERGLIPLRGPDSWPEALWAVGSVVNSHGRRE